VIPAWLVELRPAIDAELTRRLERAPGKLGEAMRYAVLGAGKRLRPALVIAACEAAGGAGADAMPAAAAVELLHAYTLIHDDLPALDDDDERRGRPTVHKVFGEGPAILAGDALLTAAFEAVAELREHGGAAASVLARRSGASELIGGQMDDLAMTGEPALAELEAIHAKKTGALFAAAAELGAIAAGNRAADREALARYGMAFGIAFQFADDRDDGDFPASAAARKQRTAELVAEAAAAASGYGALGARLVELATWIGARV
jgi:geranylgeranyl pyrophosphate synthase